MITYQEKTFREFVEKFKREELSEAKKIEIKINEWRKSFVTEYPRNSINSMSMDNYIISSKRLSNNKSFCRRICSNWKLHFMSV